MSSSEEKKTTPVEKKPAKDKKNKKSLGWIIGVIILILISITFVLPTTIFSAGRSNDQVLGVYDGEKIKLSDSYLQNQLQMLAQRAGGINDMNTYYQILTQAYQSTVYAKAMAKQSLDAGFKVTDDAIDRMIIASGIYNNADGVFDKDLYNKQDKFSKEMTREMIATNLPALETQNAIADMKNSDAEIAFIADLAKTAKSFEYALIEPSLYPVEKTIEFANADPQPFMQIGLASLTVADLETANSLKADIESGAKTFEAAVAESSIDSFKGRAGAMGSIFYFELSPAFAEADAADRIFSTELGSLTDPLQTRGGYTIIKVVAAPEMADFTDADTLTRANMYIAQKDAELMNAFLAETDAEFQARIANGEDFRAAADAMGIEIVNVAATNANPAAFPLLSTFSYTDPFGVLAYAANDQEFVKSMFKAEEGTVLPTKDVQGTKIVVRAGATETVEANTDSIANLYPYFSANMASADMQTAVFGSDKFEDKFYDMLFKSMAEQQ